MAGAGDERNEEYWDNAEAGPGAIAGEGRSEFGREAESNNRLPFDDDSDRLPWLEAEEENLEYQGNDIGRILGFFLLGLVILAALVGGIWWATHRQNDATLVADGSILDEPGQPYKEAPADPGGKTFEGTGDSSFAVSAGKDQPTEVAGDGTEVDPAVAALGKETPVPTTAVTTAAPKPVVTPSRAPVAAASPPPEPAFTPVATSAPAVSTSGVGVQVGAYSNRATAEAGWTRLQQRSSALKGMRYRIVEGQADIGTVFRLQALPGDRGAAQTLCTRLKGDGIACQVKN